MNGFINKLIHLLIKWIIPIPIVNTAIAQMLCKYKLQFLSGIAIIISLPILSIVTIFASPVTPGQPATKEIVVRQSFDNKYAVQCRDSLLPCEIKPEFRGQNVDCSNTPLKCRLIRKTGDCTQLDFNAKYCSEQTTTSIVTNPNGTSFTLTQTAVGKTPTADQDYYNDQQKEEEDGFNLFDWLGSVFSGNNGGQITATGVSGTAQNVVGIPEPLKDYIEPGILDSGTPNGNPFGGGGYNWVDVTCIYQCGGYGFNGGSHLGLDMDVKYSNIYKTNSQAYKKTGQYIIMATCSGVAKSSYELYGGNYVTIKCKDTPYYVIFMHLSAQFVPAEGVNITAGQPVGVMGSTGLNTTGSHIHYQIGTCTQYVITCTLDAGRFL